MASVKTHAVLETGTTGVASLVTGVNHPSKGLHEDGGAKVLAGVPPVTWAGGGAAGTENALVETIELLAVLDGLSVFRTVGGHAVTLEVGLDGLVLLVKLGEIGNQVADDKHVGEGVDLFVLGGVLVNAAEAGKGVAAVNVHGARTADTFTARASESKGRVLLVLDAENGIEHHWSGSVQVNLVSLHLWLLFGGVRVPSIDLELLHKGFLGGSGSEATGGRGRSLAQGRSADAGDLQQRRRDHCVVNASGMRGVSETAQEGREEKLN